MATSMLKDLRRTSHEASDAITGSIRRNKSKMTPTEVAVVIGGAAAVAGLFAAVLYYSPDFIRYLKIRRM